MRVSFLAALFIAACCLLVRFKSGEATERAENQPLDDNAPPRVEAAASSAPAPTSPAPSSSAITPVVSEGSTTLLRIKTGEVLATVNGTPLRLPDLLPLPAGADAGERTLSAERFSFLLERAVDRELVFQSAQAEGIKLSGSQQQQLAGWRAREERVAGGVFDDLQHSPASADFAARDAEALLLRVALAEKAGVPARDVTPAQVEDYYRRHHAEYPALPEETAARELAREKIEADIRVKLAGPAEASHEAGLQRHLAALRAAARIVKAEPKAL